MKKLLLATMAGALLTACGSSDDSPQPPKPNPEKDYATLIIGKWHNSRMDVIYSKKGNVEIKDFTKYPKYDICRKKSYVEFTKGGERIERNYNFREGECKIDSVASVKYKLEGNRVIIGDEEGQILKLTDKELVVISDERDLDEDGKPEKNKFYLVRVK